MLILTIRSDKPEAEVGLFNDHDKLEYETWPAHRELAETINSKIIDVLMRADVRLHQLNGIIVYKGPGSFTGLRIGVSVANALAYGLNIPIVSNMEDAWIEYGVARLLQQENERVAMPEYGALPNITQPKH